MKIFFEIKKSVIEKPTYKKKIQKQIYFFNIQKFLNYFD